MTHRLTDTELDELERQCERIRDTMTLSLIAEVRELRAERAKLHEWTLEHGAALKPKRADTYGEGMRDAKQQVRDIIAAGEQRR